VGSPCGTHWRKRSVKRVLVAKTEGTRPFGQANFTWGFNFKMNGMQRCRLDSLGVG
jgi:hypothetical protein